MVRDRYLLHYKLWRVEGKPVASEGTAVRVGEVSYWCGWDEVPLAGGKVRFRGQVNPATKRGPAIRGSATAPASG